MKQQYQDKQIENSEIDKIISIPIDFSGVELRDSFTNDVLRAHRQRIFSSSLSPIKVIEIYTLNNWRKVILCLLAVILVNSSLLYSFQNESHTSTTEKNISNASNPLYNEYFTNDMTLL